MKEKKRKENFFYVVLHNHYVTSGVIITLHQVPSNRIRLA